MHVDSAGNAVVLTGSVPDAASVERVLSIARAHFPDKTGREIINLLTVGGNQQVMIEVTVSEINRDKNRAIATNFAAEITPQRKDAQFVNRIDGLIRPASTIPTRDLVEIDPVRRLDQFPRQRVSDRQRRLRAVRERARGERRRQDPGHADARRAHGRDREVPVGR